MKKGILLLIICTMLVGTLVACSDSDIKTSDDDNSNKTEETTNDDNSDDSDATSEEKLSEDITIEFWNPWTGSDGDYLVDKVNEFNDTNEWGITVNMDITPEFSEKLATTLPTGNCAPLILTGAGDKLRYGEYLLPIDDIWNNTNLSESDFNANALEVCKMDDSLYAIPFQNSLYYMYWNKDLFEQAGLDPESPPQNFEEWAEYAYKITDYDSNTYGSGIFMSYGNHQMSLMGIDGGWAVSETDDGKWLVNIENNEGYKDYLTWMKSIYENGDNPIENEIDSMFIAGQIGIMVNGPWLAAGADEADINYGMGKIFGNEPRGDVAGFFVTNSASDEEKLACERFMQWWYTGNEGTDVAETGAGVWSLKIGFPTAYIPLAEDVSYTSNEKLSNLALDSNSKESLWSTTDPDFKGWAETNGAIGTMTESIVFGASIDEALTAAQAEVEKIVITYEGEDSLAK